MVVGPVEPTHRPQQYSNQKDVENALKRMSEFLRGGGGWTYELVVFMNEWLDHALKQGFQLKNLKKGK